MTPETIVRTRYKYAVIRPLKDRFEVGQSAVYIPGEWAVFPADGLGQIAIGTGATPEAAWATAAATVQKEKRSEIAESWVNFLLEQGYQWSKGNRHKLIHPTDGERFADFDPDSGTFRPSTPLAVELENCVGSDGKPEMK